MHLALRGSTWGLRGVAGVPGEVAGHPALLDPHPGTLLGLPLGWTPGTRSHFQVAGVLFISSS